MYTPGIQNVGLRYIEVPPAGIDIYGGHAMGVAFNRSSRDIYRLISKNVLADISKNVLSDQFYLLPKRFNFRRSQKLDLSESGYTISQQFLSLEPGPKYLAYPHQDTLRTMVAPSEGIAVGKARPAVLVKGRRLALDTHGFRSCR